MAHWKYEAEAVEENIGDNDIVVVFDDTWQERYIHTIVLDGILNINLNSWKHTRSIQKCTIIVKWRDRSERSRDCV